MNVTVIHHDLPVMGRLKINLDIPPYYCVGKVLRLLNIPFENTVILDGITATPHTELRDGDTLLVFP